MNIEIPESLRECIDNPGCHRHSDFDSEFCGSVAQLLARAEAAEKELQIRLSVFDRGRTVDEFYVSGWLGGPRPSKMTGFPLDIEEPDNWRNLSYAEGAADYEKAIEAARAAQNGGQDAG